jgi:hypothetical protein
VLSELGTDAQIFGALKLAVDRKRQGGAEEQR